MVISIYQYILLAVFFEEKTLKHGFYLPGWFFAFILGSAGWLQALGSFDEGR